MASCWNFQKVLCTTSRTSKKNPSACAQRSRYTGGRKTNETQRFRGNAFLISSIRNLFCVCLSILLVNTIGIAKKQRKNKRVQLIVETSSIYERLVATFRAIFPSNQLEKRCFPAFGSACRCLFRVIIGYVIVYVCCDWPIAVYQNVSFYDREAEETDFLPSRILRIIARTGPEVGAGLLNNVISSSLLFNAGRETAS